MAVVVVICSAHLQLHGAGVDNHFFKTDNRRRGGTFEAAQNGLDASYKLPCGEGLGNVVVRSQFEAQNPIVLASPRSQKDDRNRG